MKSNSVLTVAALHTLVLSWIYYKQRVIRSNFIEHLSEKRGGGAAGVFIIPTKCSHAYTDLTTTNSSGETAHMPRMGWLLACLTSQQRASASQGRICSDSFTCCDTEIEVANQTFHLTQSQYADTGPTSPSADPITPGAWQGSHWSANV